MLVEAPRPSLPLIIVTQSLLALLIAIGVGVQILLPGMSSDLADTFPEYADLRAPLLGLAVSFCVLLQLGIVAAAVLVQRIRSGRILRRASLFWVDAITATLALAVVLVVMGFFVISGGQAGSPFLLLMQIVTILALTSLAAITLVLRTLLRGAIALRTELDEVV